LTFDNSHYWEFFHQYESNFPKAKNYQINMLLDVQKRAVIGLSKAASNGFIPIYVQDFDVD